MLNVHVTVHVTVHSNVHVTVRVYEYSSTTNSKYILNIDKIQKLFLLFPTKAHHTSIAPLHVY